MSTVTSLPKVRSNRLVLHNELADVRVASAAVLRSASLSHLLPRDIGNDVAVFSARPVFTAALFAHPFEIALVSLPAIPQSRRHPSAQVGAAGGKDFAVGLQADRGKVGADVAAQQDIAVILDRDVNARRLVTEGLLRIEKQFAESVRSGLSKAG